MPADIRPTAVAGRFYPAEAATLAHEIETHLGLPSAIAGAAGTCAPKILLAPHAGTRYSGPIAGKAYALLRPWADRIRRVVLLGPAHRVPLRGLAAPSVAAFGTPFGPVPVDQAALAALADLPQLHTSDAAHALEHALEVQLPFLQRVLGEFSLVPLVVGDARPEQVAEVIERLWGGDETLIVISSDLSHHLPYAEARMRDMSTIDRVLRLDPALDHEDACGATPLAGALIVARRHALRPRLLDLRNSGDTASDRREVVGYAAVAFVAPHPDVSIGSGQVSAGDAQGGVAPAAPAPAEATAAGDAALGRALLAQARQAIAARFGLAAGALPRHAALDEPGASFVTLRHAGALRGCVGTLQAHRSLGEDVSVHAQAAAFDDPRFAPLSRDDFDTLQIEVSVLAAAEALTVTDEAHACRALRPGLDGVILEWRGRRATLLPQVWEQLPQPASFLRALKHKAGLAADFWAEDLRLARYRVCKFVTVEPR